MIEARVECLCTVGYQLADLNLVLHKGDVQWLPAAKARVSKDLLIAERAGAVSVRWEQRCEVTKPAPPSPHPPWLQRKNRAFASPPPPPRPAPPLADPAEDVRAMLRDVVREEVRDALRGRGGMVSSIGMTPEAVQQAVLEALKSFGGGIARGAPAPASHPSVDDSAPLFIPSGAETSAFNEVDDASAALKAARNTRRKKTGGSDAQG